MSNPFDDAYAALRTNLTAHGGLTALVKVGNRLWYDDANWEQKKASTQTADHPELETLQTSIENWGGGRTSDHIEVTQVLQFNVSSGDMRLDAKLNDVLWNLLSALENMPALGGTVLSNGVLWQPMTIQTSLDNTALNRGTRQWTGVGRVQIRHHVPRGSLPT